MTSKSEFNAEEWSQVVEAPTLAAAQVITAERGDEKATPEEASACRDFILRVAETATRAHKEGGFLGIGGTEVSEREQAVLDELEPLVQCAG